MSNRIVDEATSQRRRTLLIASVLSLVVILIGVGVTFLILANRPVTTKAQLTPAEQTTGTPAGTATASFPATSTIATGAPGGNVTSSTATTSSSNGMVVRSGQIAYRLGGRIWIAGQDGSGARAAFESTSGAYALSPDGKTLIAQSSTGSYVLVDLGTGTRIVPQWPATATPIPTFLPTWAPDSSRIAYTVETSGTGYSIWWIRRDGTGAALVLKKAADPQIAPDNNRIAFSSNPDPGPTDKLRVYDIAAKTTKFVPDGTGAASFSWTPAGQLFVVGVTGTGSYRTATLRKVTKDLASSSVVGTFTSTSADPGTLFPSPDGNKVVFAMIAEEFRSQLLVGDSTANTLKVVSIGNGYYPYPQGWLLDGTAALYIERNGSGQTPEPTAGLYRINIDGTHKSLIVQNAGT